MRKYIVIFDDTSTLTFEVSSLTELAEKLNLYDYPEDRIVSITII